MRISVIIPVYNAVNYVQEAVESALNQPETAEVLLIEDGSPYGDLVICEQLTAKYPQVHLYRHPNGANRGPGPSRNLGIQKSRFEYIAFLDADDFYLPGRFKVARQILESDLTVDGVYEAMGVFFQNEESRLDWETRLIQQGLPPDMLTTVTQVVPPDDLFEHLITGRSGYFSGNGLVVRRHVFQNAGLFSPIRHEDMAMWIKLAATSRLVAGSIHQPVAMRRVYGTNRTIQLRRDPVQAREKLIIMWKTLWRWSLGNLPHERQSLLLSNLVNLSKTRCSQGNASHRIKLFVLFLSLIASSPQAVSKSYFWKQCVREFWPRQMEQK